uniref:Histidine kinase/HSP90-like ATPase domain-containing protein n=1 Tax=Rhizochromulina marina TaxID=1034831 RepID=A0A7S2SVX7_9STRA|mmetsp:Transcript_989/g.3246  ORF Transcript_989/g.3246 Transcript_989/m.3246 type:complete len:736 (+) Transcript_989:96-2303(+)
MVKCTLFLALALVPTVASFTFAAPQRGFPAHAGRWMARGGASTPKATAVEGETYEFQAEVSRVMDIIINSLYQDKDVFLRELVSNAADACDKRRFLSLTEGGGADSMKIRIKPDKEANTLTIEDSGIGMTKDELVNNLGRIAQSGTKKFMEALGSGEADINLIGQFGVGFYSGYLVADKVSVVSKSSEGDGKQYRWESAAGSSFTVTEDDSDPIEGAGTRIVLSLKEECDEYTDEFKLRDMLKRYSSFIQFPIELWAEKTDYESVPDPDAEPPAEGEEPKMKTITKTSTEWEEINKQKPIWLRSPKTVNETEYTEFYKSTFKAYDEPTAHTHFSLEGQVEFKALLYVPNVVPFELSRDMFNENSKAIKLYVKRVFINDKFEELMPRWLTFIRGIVDSEDLPLNVGREILQKSKMLSVINKRLVKKSIEMFKDIEKRGEEEYLEFWKNFGRYLKVGIVEDNDVKDDLGKLCRFFSSKSGEDLTSLDSYVENMKQNQTQIFYVTGDGKAAAARSPVLERLNKLGYEVLYMTEPLDELTVEALSSFDGKTLVNAAKGDLNIPEESEPEMKTKKEEASKNLAELCEWLEKELKSRDVQKVEVSMRLTDSPAALVQGAYGMSPTMQRYMKAQAVAAGEMEGLGGFGNLNQATLEINPDHPIVSKLKTMVDIAPESGSTKSYATLMYDVAALASGYSIEDPSDFATRITELMTGVSSSSSSSETDSPPDDGEPENVEAEVV